VQLKAAVAFNDKERVTRTTIRLKDLFFEKNQDQFKFHKYGKLYPREAWADLKFLSMDREQLAVGMLKHTKSSIHHSLTQIEEEDKVTQSLAKAMFKNILGSHTQAYHVKPASHCCCGCEADASLCMFPLCRYMGDKKYDQPQTLAAEILRTCLEHPNKQLRTEVLCQLIKQTTANPSQESTQRGWELIVLCLATFPPPSDFENYAECFLRNFGNPPSKYVNLLHDTLVSHTEKRGRTQRELVQWEQEDDRLVPAIAQL